MRDDTAVLPYPYDSYYARGPMRRCIHCDKLFQCSDTEPWVTCGCEEARKRREGKERRDKRSERDDE
jgi:hypothetical protein